MGTYDLFGFFFVAVLAVGIGLVVSQRREDWSRRLTLVFVCGLLLRLVGSTLRYEIFFRYYHGGGDAGVYYGQGLFYANLFRRLDFGVLFDPSHWYLGHWWGTQFVRFLSGFVLTFLGPSMRGEFLVFSLLSFLGLMCCLFAFRKAYPWVPTAHYARWILFWPSLWFWPSSVGKEAVVLLAIGLTVWGHVGNGQRTRWGLLAAGLGLAWAVRPHLAAVLIVSAMISHWFLRQKRGKGPVGLMRNVLVAILALVVAVTALQRLGIDQVDVESVQEFMSHRAQLTATGGSEILPSGGWLAIPMAFVNILMRPFPWEAHNAMALVSALEVPVVLRLASSADDLDRGPPLEPQPPAELRPSLRDTLRLDDRSRLLQSGDHRPPTRPGDAVPVALAGGPSPLRGSLPRPAKTAPGSSAGHRTT